MQFEFSFSFKRQYRGASTAEQALRLFNGVFTNSLASLLQFGANEAISSAFLALKEFQKSNPDFFYFIPEWAHDAESGVHTITYTSHSARKYVFRIDGKAECLTVEIEKTSSLFFEIAALSLSKGGVNRLHEELGW